MKERFIHNTTQILYRVLFSSLLCGVLALQFTACTSEIDLPDPDDGTAVTKETAYVSFALNVDDNIATKAWAGTETGTVSENQVKSVRILLLDGDQPTSKVVEVLDYNIESDPYGTNYWVGDVAPTTNQSDKTTFITEAKKVPAGVKTALAIINPTGKLKEIAVKNTTYGDLKKGYPVSGISLQNSAGGLADENAFMMTSVQELVDIVKNEHIWSSKTSAHNKPLPMTVGRVVAKVSLGLAQSINLKPGASINDIRWNLDRINKSTCFFRNMPSGETKNTPREDWYAIDPNFESSVPGDFAYYDSSVNEFPAFTLVTDQSKYCLENTMNGANQTVDTGITRVLIRCTYKPANIAYEGESYYLFNNQIYSLDVMEKYYQSLQNLLAQQNPSADITDPLHLAIQSAESEGYYLNGKPTTGSVSGSEIKKSFRTLGGITYYYQGVNYYAAKILHFGTADSDSPGNGHYGVLRNTHYKVKIKEVKGPGGYSLKDSNIQTRSGSSDADAMFNNISTQIVRE